MSAFDRLISKARRRAVLNRALRLGAIGVLTGLGVAACGVLIERGGALEWWWGVYLVPPIAGLMVGLFVSLLKRPTRTETAVTLDRALRLRDQLGSAAAMGGDEADRARHDDGFAALVHRDADRLAGGLDARSAVPVVISAAWGVAAAGALLLAAGVMFLPRAQWRDTETSAQLAVEREEVDAARERVVREIESSLVDMERDLEDVDDPLVAEQLAALDELRAQLMGAGDGTEGAGERPEIDQPRAAFERARDESAAAMSDLAESLDKRAERDLRAVEQVQRRFDRLPQHQPPLSAEQFTEALQRGDFGEAATALEQLLDERDTLTPEERQAAAEHLREMREAVESADENTSRSLDARREALRQALRDQGIDERDAERLLRDGAEAAGDEEAPDARAADQIRDELVKGGVDGEVADEIARDLQSLREDAADQQQTSEDAQSLGEALNEAAEQLDGRRDDRASDEPDAAERDEQQEQAAREQQQRSSDAAARDEQESTPGNAATGRADDDAAAQPSAASDSPDAQQRDDTRRSDAQGGETNERQEQPAADGDAAAGQSARSATSDEPSSDAAQQRVAGEDPEEDPGGEPTADESQPQATPDEPGAQAGADEQAREEGDPQAAGQPDPSKQEQQQQQQPGSGFMERAVQELAKRVDPETMRKLAESVDPEMLKKLAEQVDPEAMKRIAQKMDKDTLRKLAESVDPQTLKELAEKIDPQTLKELAEKMPQPEQTPQGDPPPNSPDTPNPPVIDEQSMREVAETLRDRVDPETMRDIERALQPPPGEPSATGEAGREAPSEKLRDLARRQAEAQRRSEAAERARDAARGILNAGEPEADQPSDAVARGPDDRAGQPGRGSGGRDWSRGRGNLPVGETEPGSDEIESQVLDLGDDEIGSETIAQWLSDQPLDEHAEPGRTTQAGRAQRIQRARSVAERAVNESAVPARYHDLIKRYFGGLDETLDRARQQGAKDAGGGSGND